MKRMIAAVVACAVVAGVAIAERPPEKRSEAVAVVTGEVTKIGTSKGAFGRDGVKTTYTAEVKVEKVEKGDVKAGDTIKVTWFHVTKIPTGGMPGAYGQGHKLAEADKAMFWLSRGDGKGTYALNYNKDAVEKVKK